MITMNHYSIKHRLIKRIITNNLFLLFTILALPCFSQENAFQGNLRNTLFLEGSFNSNLDFYSILYDRTTDNSGTFKSGFQAGLAFTTHPWTSQRQFSLVVPIKWYFLFGKRNDFFETSLGLKIVDFFYPELYLGYRHKPKKNGISYKAGYSAILLSEGINTLIGVSIGYNF